MGDPLCCIAWCRICNLRFVRCARLPDVPRFSIGQCSERLPFGLTLYPGDAPALCAIDAADLPDHLFCREACVQRACVRWERRTRYRAGQHARASPVTHPRDFRAFVWTGGRAREAWNSNGPHRRFRRRRHRVRAPARPLPALQPHGLLPSPLAQQRRHVRVGVRAGARDRNARVRGVRIGARTHADGRVCHCAEPILHAVLGRSRWR
mmetsp:Transcript_29538/g.74237  ORF Transcript_29538/g.74237 Transcript_29538/m.74237 type:complete len:208 (+) Transcript_29538:950-1573(+)